MERAYGDPNKPQYFDSKLIEHSANLAVLSFVKYDLDPGIALARA